MAQLPITIEALKELEPFGRLSEGSVRELIGLCYRERVGRGNDPFRTRGPSGQSIYLLKGELLLRFLDESTEVIVGGSEGARVPLGKRSPSFSSAKAITGVELLRVDDDVLDIMLTWDQLAAPAEGKEAAAEGRTDWRTMSGIYAAQNLTRGVFASLPPANIEGLLARFERVPVARGQVVIREGEPGDYYFVIERGRCEVTRATGGVTMALAELKAGDAFGEEALLADCARNATVTMRSDGVLLRLDKRDFTELLREPLLHRVNLSEAREKARRGAVWLDVRFRAEFQLDRIPDAINIPLNEIRSAIGALDKGREYIVYCQTGRRSSAAAFLMSQRGLRAFLLDGGLQRWAGEPAARHG